MHSIFLFCVYLQRLSLLTPMNYLTTLLFSCFVGTTSATAQDMALADSIVKYQMASGGWAKNQNWLAGCDQRYMAECMQTGVGSTIDNGATTSELEVLAKTLKKHGKPEYYTAFVRGLQFLLNMQYDNGGWRQFFPQRSSESYANHITFNDNAMVRVMRLLWDVAKRREDVGSVDIPENMRTACKIAFWKGVGCILNCQIKDKEGRLTVWCQQHDENTLLPAPARKYELASYCGFGESVDIVMLLMDILDETQDFSNTDVNRKQLHESVESAIVWFETHPIRDRKIVYYTNAEGKPDKKMVEEKGAPLLWARYYDLEKGEPMYSDRRGEVLRSFNDIQYERRNGYQWVGDSPAKAIRRWR